MLGILGFFDVFIGIFMLLIIVAILISIISTKRNGIKVLATITDIQEEERTDSEGYAYTGYIIMCSCYYEGINESRLYYNYKLNYKDLKPGDTIDCIYNKKKKYFTTSDNIKGSILMLIILIIAFGLFIMLDFIPKLFNVIR